MTKQVLLSTLASALALSTATLSAQMPQMSAKLMATHGSTRLSSDKAVLCGTKQDGDCLIFQSNDLPEAKPITVQAVMAKPFTDTEIATLGQTGYKSATVTCSTVTVNELTNAQNGRVMQMATGTGCVINDLKVRPR